MSGNGTLSSSAKVLGVVRKSADLETHIRTVELDGISVLEFRDYIPSLGEYGRGYWLPVNGQVLNETVQVLLRVMNEGV